MTTPTTITIGSTKGGFTGTIEQVAEWLADQQPSGSYVYFDDGSHEDIEVKGTPGPKGWQKGIEAALARAAE